MVVKPGQVGTAGNFLGAQPSPGSATFTLIFVPLIFTAFGLSMILVGVQHRERVQPIPGGVTTTGVVAGNHRLDRGYEPVVRFRDDTGVIHQFRGVSGGATPVGTQVRVSYDPQDPARARDLSQPSSVWWQLWLGVGVLVLEALVVVGFVVLARRMKRRQRRARPA